MGAMKRLYTERQIRQAASGGTTMADIFPELKAAKRERRAVIVQPYAPVPKPAAKHPA